jgi:antitoxin YefM
MDRRGGLEYLLIQYRVQYIFCAMDARGRRPILDRYSAMAHTSFTELRQNMASFFDQVTEDREPLVVTRQGGKANVVIMSEDEFTGWQETVHLLRSPANAKRLMASVRKVRSGATQERELMAPGETRTKA